MQLVTHTALGSVGQHGGAFVAERVRMLVAAELAPCGVELSCHSQELEGQVACVFRRGREMVVAPTSCRQGLQLEVAEIGQNIMPTAGNVAAVVEDRHVRAD